MPFLENHYNTPDNYANLTEVAAPAPVDNPDEQALYRHVSLEEFRSQEQEYVQSQSRNVAGPGESSKNGFWGRLFQKLRQC